MRAVFGYFFLFFIPFPSRGHCCSFLNHQKSCGNPLVASDWHTAVFFACITGSGDRGCCGDRFFFLFSLWGFCIRPSQHLTTAHRPDWRPTGQSRLPQISSGKWTGRVRGGGRRLWGPVIVSDNEGFVIYWHDPLVWGDVDFPFHGPRAGSAGSLSSLAFCYAARGLACQSPVLGLLDRDVLGPLAFSARSTGMHFVLGHGRDK